MPKFLDDIIAVGGSKVLLNATSTAFSDKLYVSSDAYTTGGWRVGSAATYVGKTYNSSGKLTIESDGNRDIQFQSSNNSSIMYIDTSTQRVGIGTTSPGDKLHVQDGYIRAAYSGGADFKLIPHSSNDGYGFYDVTNTNYDMWFDGGLVGIGTTSPAYALDVASAGNTGVRITSAGTGAIQLRYENSGGHKGGVVVDNNGLYRIDATNIQLNSTANVGIGTASPSAKLHVAESNQSLGFSAGIFVSANPSDYTVGRGSGITFKNADVNTGGIYGIREANNWTGSLAFYTHTSAANNTFGSTFTEKMRITSDGKVGVGHTALYQKFTVNGNIDIRGGNDCLLTFNNGDGGIGVQYNNTGTVGRDIAIKTYEAGVGNTEKMRVTKDGKVGIGTTTPSSALDVNGTLTHVRTQGTVTESALSGTATASALLTTNYTHTGSNTNGTYARQDYLNLAGSGGSFQNVAGYQMKTNVTSTGTSTAIKNIMSRVHTASSGDINQVASFVTHNEFAGSGNVGSWAGLAIADFGGGFENTQTVTNTYGIKIGDITHGTQTNAPYAIHTGSERVHFGGNLNVGGNANISGTTDLGGRLAITTTDDNKLDLIVPSSGDSTDWNYIQFKGADGVRDAYFGTQNDGTPAWYRDDGATHLKLLSSYIYASHRFQVNGELEATSLDINGNADISGNLTMNNGGKIDQGTIYIQDQNGGRIGWNRNTSNGAIHDSNYNAFQAQVNTSGADGKFEIQAYTGAGGYGGSFLINVNAQPLINDYILHNGDDDTHFGFSGANDFRVHTGGSDRFQVSGDVGVLGTTDFFIQQGRKLLLDGAGGHTYLEEESDSNLKVYVAGAEQLNITNGGSYFTNHLSVAATKRLYLDGGTNTYITEASGDTLNFVTGANVRLSVNNSHTTVSGILQGGNVFAKGTYCGGSNTSNGFLIETNIITSNYAMMHGTIKLEQFNFNTFQTIEFSVTTNSNGTIITKAGKASTTITIKLFNYNSKWYVWVPQPSSYTTCTAFIGLAYSYQGQEESFNEVEDVSHNAVPSSGVSNSTDLICSDAITSTSATFSGSVISTDGSDTTTLSHTGLVLSRSNSYIQSNADNSDTLNIGQSSVRWGHVKVDSATFKVLNGGTERFGINSSGNSSFHGDLSNVGASHTVSLSSGSNIRGSNHLFIQGDASYVHIKSNGNNVYLDGVSHNFRNVAANTSYLVLDSTRALFNGEVEATSLDINGNADISGTLDVGAVNADGNITVTKSSATVKVEESGGADVRIVAGGSTGYIGTYSNDTLQIQQNSGAAITIDTSRNSTFAGTVNIVGTNSTNQESVLLRGITANGGDLLGSIRTANTGGYNQEMRFYTSNADGTSDEDLTLTLKPDQSATFAGNVTVSGDLTVSGTTTTVNQTNLDVADNIIGLNRGSASNTNDSGIIIERGDVGNNAALIWDEGDDHFVLGTTASDASSTGGSIVVAGGNLKLGGLLLDGKSITGIDNQENFTNADDHIMTSAAIEDKILGYSYTANALPKSGGTMTGNLTFNNPVRELKWEHTSGQSSSRSWSFIGEQGVYGRFELRRSDAADNTPDTTVLRFDQSNATFTGSVYADGGFLTGQTSQYSPTGGGDTLATFTGSGNDRQDIVVSNQTNHADAGAAVVLATHGHDFIIEGQSSAGGSNITFHRAAALMATIGMSQATFAGELEAASLDINGAADILGTLNVQGVTTLAGDPVIHDDSSHVRLYLRSDSAHQSLIYFGRSGATTQGRVAYNNLNDSLYFNSNNATALTLDSSQNATFAGGISMSDSILINYTGSDGQAIDAGVKVMNDASDWGMYVRKHSNANYGIRIDSGGADAFNIYSTTGGSTKTFNVHGGTGNTTIAGGLTVAGNTVKGYATGTRTINSTSYTMIGTVAGDRLASVIELTLTGTSSNVVIGASFEITVMHSQDIFVKSMNGDYRDIKIKITSNNNEDFSIEAMHTTTQADTPMEVCMFPKAGETCVVTGTDPGYSGLEHEHTAFEGTCFSASDNGNAGHRVLVNGELEASALDINGNADISGTLTLNGLELGAVAERIRNAGDTDSYIDFGGADTINFATNGANRLVITNDNSTFHNDIVIDNHNGSNPTDGGSLYFNEAGTTWGTNMFGFRINQEGSSNLLQFQSVYGDANVNTILTLNRDNKNAIFGAKIQTSGEIEGGSLDINGNADISGNLTVSGTYLTLNGVYPRIKLTDSNNNDDYDIINNNGTFIIFNDTDSSIPLAIAGNNNATFAGDVILSTTKGLYTNLIQAISSAGLQLGNDNNSGYVFVKDSGEVCVGTKTPSSNTNYGTGEFNVESDSFTAVQIMSHNSTAGNYSFLGMGKSSGTGASPTIVQANETVAGMRYYGYDGNDYRTLATISAAVDGTPGDDDMPGKLEFWTTADGASSPTKRLTISSSGIASFNGHVNLDDNNHLLWGGNAIITHTGSATNIGDNSSSSVLVLSSGNATFENNVSLGDNKNLDFGAATDFRIVHNSSTNVNHISSKLDRQLSLNGNYIFLTNQANTESMARFYADAEVKLYYDSVQKFQTTSTGIEVSGTSSTFAGKVGVGTAPTTQLQVRGAITTLGDARYNLRLDDATTMAAGVGAGIVFGGQYITGNTTPTNFAAVWSKKENATSGEYGGELHLGTRIDNGNISSDLIINSSGNATFAGNVTLNGDGKLLKFTPTSYDDVELGIDSNGFVIYNTTDSRYDLKISGTGNATFGGSVHLDSDSAQLQFGDDNDMQIFHDGANAYFKQQKDNGDVYFQNDRGDGNNANFFYLDGGLTDNSGTLGATVFPDKSKIFMGSSNDLQIYHDGSNSYVTESGTGNLFIQGSDHIYFRSADTAEYYAQFNDDGACKFYYNNAVKLETTSAGVSVTGAMTASADVVAFSDKKLKENIETLDGKKVLDMRGVSFTRKDTGKESSGVIAQEIQKVAPELVHDTEGTLGVAYGNLVGYLIEAVKDQQKQIDKLKAIINGSSK